MARGQRSGSDRGSASFLSRPKLEKRGRRAGPEQRLGHRSPLELWRSILLRSLGPDLGKEQPIAIVGPYRGSHAAPLENCCCLACCRLAWISVRVSTRLASATRGVPRQLPFSPRSSCISIWILGAVPFREGSQKPKIERCHQVQSEKAGTCLSSSNLAQRVNDHSWASYRRSAASLVNDLTGSTQPDRHIPG